MGRLFWKILFTFWSTLLLAGLVTGFAVWLQQREIQNEQTDLSQQPSSIMAIRAAANTYVFAGKTALTNLLQEQQQEAPASAQVYAVDDKGQELLGRSIASDIVERIRTSVMNDEKQPASARLVIANNVSYLLFVPKQNANAQINPRKRSFFARSHVPSWLLISIGIVVSFISSWLLASYFSRPIRTLRQAFHGLAEGNLAQRVNPAMGTRRDELSDLSRDFDHMAEQIQSLMHSQKRLLHDVSHELRSPLARLQVSIGLARQQPERCLQTLERIEREAQRLDHLVGEVLTLSRLEAGVPQAIDEYLDILELLDAVVDDARFEAQALNKQVNFYCELGDALITKGYGELLFRAFDNVIRNALHHTPEHSSVQVSVQWLADMQQLQVTVEDCGKGVDPEELQSIFAAFQRSQQPSAHKGYGLGLAIARRAIETHQGRIWAENRSEGGLRISILLPIKP